MTPILMVPDQQLQCHLGTHSNADLQAQPWTHRIRQWRGESRHSVLSKAFQVILTLTQVREPLMESMLTLSASTSYGINMHGV